MLESIPTHFFQYTLLPKNLCNRIDAISRDFLWGSFADKRKMHMISVTPIVIIQIVSEYLKIIIEVLKKG